MDVNENTAIGSTVAVLVRSESVSISIMSTAVGPCMNHCAFFERLHRRTDDDVEDSASWTIVSGNLNGGVAAFALVPRNSAGTSVSLNVATALNFEPVGGTRLWFCLVAQP